MNGFVNKRRWFQRLCFVMASLLCAGCLHASPQTKMSQAFTAPSDLGLQTPSNLAGRGVLRVRPVRLNLSLFNETAAQRFISRQRESRDWTELVGMNFFDDAGIIVEWTEVERVSGVPPGFVWKGRVMGSKAGQAIMAVSGSSVTGEITRGDGRIFQIRTTADSSWWVRVIDQKAFPAEAQPVVPDFK